MKIRGIGKPYRIDCWSGEIEEIGCYRQENGRTVLDLCLSPGEAAMLMVDTNAQDEIHAVKTNVDCLTIKSGRFMAAVSKSGEYETVFSDGSKEKLPGGSPRRYPASCMVPGGRRLERRREEDYSRGQRLRYCYK